MTTTRRPILVTKVLHAEGEPRVRLRVYCDARMESVSLDACRVCSACVAIAGDTSSTTSWVECDETNENIDQQNRERGVGSVLSGHTLCVRSDVPVAELPAVFLAHDVSVLLVVDANEVLLGEIRERSLLQADDLNIFHRARGELREHISKTPTTAAEIMSSARCAHAHDSLHGALIDMAHGHARQIAVVAKDGSLIGILHDLDAIAALAAEKRVR